MTYRELKKIDKTGYKFKDWQLKYEVENCIQCDAILYMGRNYGLRTRNGFMCTKCYKEWKKDQDIMRLKGLAEHFGFSLVKNDSTLGSNKGVLG